MTDNQPVTGVKVRCLLPLMAKKTIFFDRWQKIVAKLKSRLPLAFPAGILPFMGAILFTRQGSACCCATWSGRGLQRKGFVESSASYREGRVVLGILNS